MARRRSPKLLLLAPLVLLLLAVSHKPPARAASAGVAMLGVRRTPTFHQTHHLARMLSVQARQATSATNSTSNDPFDGEPRARVTATAGGAATAVETSLYTGEGSHTIQVLVGEQVRELIIDTGSGKTAFVCDGCVHCGDRHRHDPFTFTPTTRYLTCEEAGDCMACEKAESGSNGADKCRYGQTYVEGDYWTAYKVTDEMTFAPGVANKQDSSNTLSSPVDFGCIFEQSGVFTSQTADGIMGFSRHPDSIVEQLYASGATRSRIFSQCLSDDGGSLTLGGVDLSINDSKVHYTPMRDTGYQYWTASLASVSVGNPNNKLNIDASVFNSDRGCVLDSGTTFMYLPTAAREPFIAAWRKATGSGNYFPESTEYYPDVSPSDVASADKFPPICFHFLNAAELCMPASKYFTPLSNTMVAGTIFFSDAVKSTILGASVLTDHVIIYDIDGNRIGMAPAHCDRPSSDDFFDGQHMRVELSVNPGGERFEHDAEFYGKATEWLLVAVTMFALTGLVNTVWVTSVRTLVQVPPKPTVKTDRKSEELGTLEVEVDTRLLLDDNRSGSNDDTVGRDGDDEEFAFRLME